MASPQFAFRCHPTLLAAIRDAADREGRSPSEEVVDVLTAHYLGREDEPAPASLPRRDPPRQPAAAAPKADRARTVLATAEARQGVQPARMNGAGVSASAAMAAAGVSVYDGKKRPAYQRGEAGQGKAGKGRARR